MSEPVDVALEAIRHLVTVEAMTEPAARFPCPCCGRLTLPEEPPGTFFICPVCGWEDDNVQAGDVNLRGGANRLSLQQAQENFRRFGASRR